jgi:cytochrome c-type biogenesis protein CcmH
VKPLLVALAVLVTACSSSAFDAKRDPAAEIESKVWSPYCPGRLLADCPTTQARELRDEIETRVERGESETAILSWVKQEFGPGSVAEPDASAGGLVIWLVPAAIFLAGVVIVVRRVRARAAPA